LRSLGRPSGSFLCEQPGTSVPPYCLRQAGAHPSTIGGSLQISTDVIAKIAKLATLEIEGVKEVSTGTMGVKSLFNKVNLQKPILVQLTDDVAEITVNIMVRYGYKIPQLCEKVQENVKSSVQNMTCITVSKVNIVVTGVAQETAGPEAE